MREETQMTKNIEETQDMESEKIEIKDKRKIGGKEKGK